MLQNLDVERVNELDCCYFSLTYFQECEVSAMADHSKWCKVTCNVKEFAKLSDCDEDLLHFVVALALKRPIGEEVRKFQYHVINFSHVVFYKKL